MNINETEEFLKSLHNDIEWLQTTDGDEIECISIENLTHYLRQLFNK